MRWSVGFLALVLLTLTTPLNAQSPRQHAQNLIQPSPSYDGKNHQPNSAIVSAPVHADSPEPQEARATADQENPHSKNELTRYAFWSPLAQYLIFFATLIYAGVAIYQLWAIHRQADIAAEATAVAKRSVEIAQLSLHIDRPYLVAHTFELTGFPKQNDSEGIRRAKSDGVGYEGRFLMKNLGKSPAIISEMCICVQPVEKIPNARDFWICHDIQGFMEFTAVSPGEEIEPDRNFLGGWIKPREYQALVEGKLTFIFYGVIRYRDLFEGTYETGFCAQYSMPNDFFSDDYTGHFFQLIAHRGTHNYNT